MKMKNDTLTAAYAVRSKARTALAAASAALERGQRIATTSAERLHELEERSEQSEAAQATRLAALIAADSVTDELPPTHDASVGPALALARSDFNVARAALSKLRAAHESAETYLAAAEAAVVRTVDEMFLAEDDETARLVSEHLDEALRLGRGLLDSAFAGELDGHKPSQRASDVLLRLELPVLDRKNVPINIWAHGNDDVRGARSARRADLIAGDVPEEQAAA